MKPQLARNSILATLAAVVGFASLAAADTITDRFEQTDEVQPGVEVSLTNTNGNVEIRIWDKPPVKIIAEKRVRSRDSSGARDALDAIEIQVRESDGRVEIKTELPKSSTGMMSWLFGRHVDASVSYEIRLPASASLDVTTVNGSVHSDGAEGEQRLRSTNGKITVERAHAGITASTTNGSISGHKPASSSSWLPYGFGRC